jgi:hypothetical protein
MNVRANWWSCAATVFLIAGAWAAGPQIDCRAPVTRHNVTLNKPHPLVIAWFSGQWEMECAMGRAQASALSLNSLLLQWAV